MSVYSPTQLVTVFMADVQRRIGGIVVTATSGCVLVSLNDRMVPVNVDPADRFRIQPATAVPT